MADNLLRTCSPTTSWYDFASSLSWSDKCEVAEVLSDIPLISVGVLAFGVSTLFLAMKRVSSSAVLLLFSALLAFVAAVLDLGQTLADGMAMNATFAASEHAIRAREVLFALSVGFRFLFYWSYVAEPSRKDLSAVTIQRARRIKCFIFQWTYEPRNASWVHWGLPGKLAGAGLLVAIIIITALQIVWRVVPQFHQYNNVYATDVVLELLLSFLLLLKLLLNFVTLNSVDGTLVHTSSEYLAPISGLLVNIAIGVGDLLCFAFTESMVGRLLQAFEVYIIVVFAMVTAFLRHRDTLLFTTSLQGEKRRGPVPILPEFARGSTFRITLPLTETPRVSTIFGTSLATQNREPSRDVLHRSTHRSLNHISPWLPFRISRRRSRQEDEEIKLWNAEEVKANSHTGDTDTKLSSSFDTSTLTPRRWPERVGGVSANQLPIISTPDAQSPTPGSVEDSIHSGQILYTSRADVAHNIPLQVRTSSDPIPSAPSSMAEAKHVKDTVSSPEASPVYGLGGIQSTTGASESRTSLDELLRQQSELERTIETLKLFSAETFMTDPSCPNRVPRLELARSPSTGQRTVCSEVASLSNFPIPPELTTPVPSLPPSTSSFIKRIRGDRRIRLAAAQPTSVQDTDVLVPPKILGSLIDTQGSPCLNSIPHTPTEENEFLPPEAGKSFHHDPRETRYNVTSFIGGRTFFGVSDDTSNVPVVEDLATPGEPCQGSQEKSWWPTENNSSSGSIRSGSDTRLPPHGLEGFSCSPIAGNLSRSSRLPQEDSMQRRTSDQTCCSPIALSKRTSWVDRTEEDVPGPPIVRGTSSPSMIVSEGDIDRAQRVSVRRRPPPLDIQSYTEHNPGAWQVQVLADD